MRKRFLFHFHTHHSFDSRLTAEEILETAVQNQIDVIAPCDHNTLAGAREVAALSREKGIETIIGAEYSSDHGDIIGLFLQEEIDTRKVDELILEIHNQGGIVIVPHPFRSRILDDERLEQVDGIEVFNARLSQEHNAKAGELAERLDKPRFYGCDAHLRCELELVLSEFEQSEEEPFRPALLCGTTPLRQEQTTLANIYRSQMIRGRRLNRSGLYLKSLVRHWQHRISRAKP